VPEAAILVCPEYFIPTIPSTYISDEHSAVGHLERHCQLYTGNKKEGIAKKKNGAKNYSNV
jgi:hypothetical protein